ncbi:MAG: flagellar hook-basal body complex protein FliE [Phycisphaerales bacterium]|nr:flagellar hook-basal body complex protein FliE [Phycisphaerales bacterium]
MADPLGLITSGSLPVDVTRQAQRAQPAHDGPSFKDLLKQQIEEVNALQQDARAAVEDLGSGKREDLEGVILATQRAETAFRLLLQVRNKVMDAYEEVKQIRV